VSKIVTTHRLLDSYLRLQHIMCWRRTLFQLVRQVTPPPWPIPPKYMDHHNLAIPRRHSQPGRPDPGRFPCSFHDHARSGLPIPARQWRVHGRCEVNKRFKNLLHNFSFEHVAAFLRHRCMANGLRKSYKGVVYHRKLTEFGDNSDQVVEWSYRFGLAG